MPLINELKRTFQRVNDFKAEKKATRRTLSAVSQPEWQEEIAQLRKEAMKAWSEVDTKKKGLFTFRQFYDCCVKHLGLDWTRVKIRRSFYSFNLDARERLPQEQFEELFPLLLVEEFVFIVRKPCKAYFDRNDVSKFVEISKGEPVLVSNLDGSFAKLSNGLFIDATNLKSKDRFHDLATRPRPRVPLEQDSPVTVDSLDLSSEYDGAPKTSFSEVMKVLSPRSQNQVLPKSPNFQPPILRTRNKTGASSARVVQFSFTGTVDTDVTSPREASSVRRIQYSCTGTIDSDLDSDSEELTDLPGIPGATPQRSPSPASEVIRDLRPPADSASKPSPYTFSPTPQRKRYHNSTLSSDIFVKKRHVPSFGTLRSSLLNSDFNDMGVRRHLGPQPSVATLNSSLISEEYDHLVPAETDQRRTISEAKSFATIRSSMMGSTLSPVRENPHERPEIREPYASILSHQVRGVVASPPDISLPSSDFVKPLCERTAVEPEYRIEKPAHATITIPVNISELMKRKRFVSPDSKPVRSTDSKPSWRSLDETKPKPQGVESVRRIHNARSYSLPRFMTPRYDSSPSRMKQVETPKSDPTPTSQTTIHFPKRLVAGSNITQRTLQKLDSLKSTFPSTVMKYEINDALLLNSSSEEDDKEFPARLHSLISDSSEALTKCLQFREKHKKILGPESKLEGLDEEDSWAYDDDMSSTVFESEVVDRPYSPMKSSPALFTPYIPNKRPVTPENRGFKKMSTAFGAAAAEKAPETKRYTTAFGAGKALEKRSLYRPSAGAHTSTASSFAPERHAPEKRYKPIALPEKRYKPAPFVEKRSTLSSYRLGSGSTTTRTSSVQQQTSKRVLPNVVFPKRKPRQASPEKSVNVTSFPLYTNPTSFNPYEPRSTKEYTLPRLGTYHDRQISVSLPRLVR